MFSNENDQRICTHKYYIAYIDILGYKDYLKNRPEDSERYLHTILDAVENTKDGIQRFRKAKRAFHIQGEIQIRIFSDNILVCLPVQSGKNEIRRAILFLITVASIQTALVLAHRLIVRGGITIGELFINEDLVFGQGLVEAVALEEENEYPNISISNSFQQHLHTMKQDSNEEYQKLLSIIKKDEQELTHKEQEFLKKNFARIIRKQMNIESIKELIQYYENESHFLNYLYDLSFTHLLPPEVNHFAQKKAAMEPNSLKGIVTSVRNLPFIISTHKDVVEDKVWLYCNYDGIDRSDKKAIATHERVIRKYVWLLRYHNSVCGAKEYPQYLIKHKFECDESFLRLIVILQK